MGRFNLFESLEGRQLFAGMPAQFGSPRGPVGQPPAIDQSATKTAPVAVYQGTITFSEDSTTRPFSLVILTEGTDGAVTASIPGHHGRVQLTGTKSGSTYTLSGGKDGNTVSVTATVDADGKVTGTFTRTYTEDGTTVTDTGSISLTKADNTQPPTNPGQGPGRQGPPKDGTDTTKPAAPIAVYEGTLTISDCTSKKFGLAIITENADGTVTARIGHRDGIELAGTKSGSTYTLTGTKGTVSVSITATVDASGNLTGTYSKTTTATDGNTTTESGTLALTKKAAPTKPEKSSDSSGSTTTTTTTVTDTTLSKTSTESKTSTSTRPTISNLVTYKGNMTFGTKTAEVTIQTYTLSTGKTLVTIRSRALLGRRTLVLEATINGNSITASRTDGERSVAVNLTTATDGSIAGSVSLKKGTIERTLTIDADKVTAPTTT